MRGFATGPEQSAGRIRGPGLGHGTRCTVRAVNAAVLFLVALVSVAVAGCGAAEATDAILISIDQALATESGQAVKVQGMLVATETETRLASALLESYPPQAGGSTLILENLDLQTLVGLNSTAGQPDMPLVTWSNYPVVLEGIIEDGVLDVKVVPLVLEAGTAEVRVRFTPVIEPILGTDMVWWVFDVTNLVTVPLDLTFPSGQRGEVILSQNGVEVYRWSKSKSFVQAVTVDTVPPGSSRAIVLNDMFAVAPGIYAVTAEVTASVGPEGAATPPPEIVTTLTVD